jgi:hypothetical protein
MYAFFAVLISTPVVLVVATVRSPRFSLWIVARFFQSAREAPGASLGRVKVLATMSDPFSGRPSVGPITPLIAPDPICDSKSALGMRVMVMRSSLCVPFTINTPSRSSSCDRSGVSKVMCGDGPAAKSVRDSSA